MSIHETCKCSDESNAEKREFEKDFDDTHAIMLEKHLTDNKQDLGCTNVIDLIMEEPIISIDFAGKDCDTAVVVTPEGRTLYFDNTGIYGSDEDVKRYLESSEHQHPLSREYKSFNERPKVNHYQQGAIEPIDFITSNQLNFNLGNAIKYITRCNYKGSKVEDLKKAIDYLNFELEKES